MKNCIFRVFPFFVTIFISCSRVNNGSLNSLAALYGGKFSVEDGTRISISNGKEKYVKLTSENNMLIRDGWLSPESMANNCAILLTKSNSEIAKEKDFLEIEISNAKKTYRFSKQDLNELNRDYNLAENFVIRFVKLVKSNDLNRAKSLIEIAPKISEDDITASLLTFKSSIFPNHIDTKLIGYRLINETERGFVIDGLLIAEDETKRLFNVTLVTVNDSLKLRGISF